MRSGDRPNVDGLVERDIEGAEALTSGEGRRLYPVVHAQLVEEGGDVVLDGAGADEQPPRDLGIPAAVGDEGQYVALPEGEDRQPRCKTVRVAGVAQPHRPQEV